MDAKTGESEVPVAHLGVDAEDRQPDSGKLFGGLVTDLDGHVEPPAR
ncbi:hypothetical protein ACFY7Z_15970 [Streptomyces sp. NPDC012623]